jgi:hypothetical protein
MHHTAFLGTVAEVAEVVEAELELEQRLELELELAEVGHRQVAIRQWA